MPLQIQQTDCFAAPGGADECIYTSFCFPCSFGDLVKDVVAADPTAAYLHGCSGNACMSFIGYSMIPYVGSIIATTSMIPPVYAKVAGPMEPPLACWTALCCAGCVVCQLKNEVALRRMQGQPIVQAGMAMMPGMYMQQPQMMMQQNPQMMQQNPQMMLQPQYAQPQYAQPQYAQPQQYGR